jgi:hypothetical protein
MQKELWPFFQQVRKVLNWAVDWLGLVGVDDTDTPGTLWDKLLVGTGLTKTKTGITGMRTYTLDANATAIVDTIVNNPTLVQIFQTTVVQTVDPAVESTYLYSALVPNPLFRTPVRALSAIGQGYGLNFDQWEPIGGLFTWRGLFDTQVYGYGVGGANFPLAVDDRFVVVGSVRTGYDPGIYDGTYEIVIAGEDGVSPAVFRRTSDANTSATLCVGMVTQITGVGAANEGKFYTVGSNGGDDIIPDTTAISWVVSDTRGSADAYNLLTAAQVSDPAVSTETLSYSITYTGPGEAAFPDDFVSLVGVPGLNALPAGLYGHQIEGAWLLDYDPAFTTTIKAVLIDCDTGGLPEILVAESPPITATAPAPLTFQGNLAAPYTSSPSKRLLLEYRISTDSTNPVTLYLLYNSPNRKTWVKVPFRLTSGFSSVPAGAITPGLFQPGEASVTTVAGIIPAPTSNSLNVTVDAGLVVNGMQTAGLIPGTIFWLTFITACKIANGAAVSAGEAPFYLQNMAGSPMDIDWNDLIPQTGGRIGVQYKTSGIPQAPCFQLVAGPIS